MSSDDNSYARRANMHELEDRLDDLEERMDRLEESSGTNQPEKEKTGGCSLAIGVVFFLLVLLWILAG